MFTYSNLISYEDYKVFNTDVYDVKHRMLYVSLVVRCTQRATTMVSIDDIHYVIVNLNIHIKIPRAMKEYTINVMVIEDGYPEIHTKDLSEIDADELVDKLRELFPQYYYYKEFVEVVEEFDDEERHYNNNAVDGWEDLYPDRDY